MPEILLVRHGHPQSYRFDAGLTGTGAAAAERFARQLALPVNQVRHAPARRTTETAQAIAAVLATGKVATGNVEKVEVAPEEGLLNLRVHTPAGWLDPTAAQILLDQDPLPDWPAAAWAQQVRRFWEEHAAGGDAIGLWLRGALDTFEAPAAAAERYVDAALRLLRAGCSPVVCCGHSGPIRAVATAARGRDAGEPDFLEHAVLRLGSDGCLRVVYRGREDVLTEAGLGRLPGGQTGVRAPAPRLTMDPPPAAAELARASVVIVGTLDTKGAEYQWLRERLQAHGAATLMIDAGVLDAPTVPADVPREEVARRAGTSLARLRTEHDRGRAIEAMSAGVAQLLRELADDGKLDGVVALGGSNGTRLATAAMRTLPIGVPKLMVSTMASGDTRVYVGGSDIVMFHAVVDVVGINPISGQILNHAAAAIAGMAGARRFALPAARLLVGISSFGVTHPAVAAVHERLAELGYDAVAFHANGSGGQSLESYLLDGRLAGVVDLTTSEVGCDLFGGVLSAGPARLEAAGQRGVPQVVSVGGADMVSFGPANTVPAVYAGRSLYPHNASVTLMRTSPTECRTLGAAMARKLNRARGPVRVVLPLRGVSALDAPGERFYDPAADTALFDALRQRLDPAVAALNELDLHINDPTFGRALAEACHELIQPADRQEAPCAEKRF